MGRISRVFLVAGITCAGLAGTRLAAAAPAALKCGDRVTASITLTADVGPCPKEGLVVKADGITVNLGGHRLLGVSGPSDDPGVLLEGRTGVTVTNGEITDFGAAIAIVGGSGNTINAVRAHDNIGFLDASGNYGDGIAILDSPGNAVIGSTIEHNGPFDGIGVFGAASVGNRLEQNTVTRNDIARFNSNLGLHLNLDDGINLGSGLGGGQQTTVRGNTITANGFNGINACSVRGNPCQTTDNVITNNLVQGNGYGDPTTADDNIDIGDGIHVVSVVPSSGDPFPPIRDVISSNRVLENAGDGIVVASSTSVITGNVAFRNGSAIRKFFFDVDDISLNNDCDTNIWSGNTFQTAFPRCLLDGNRKRGSEPKPIVAASALDLSRKRPA